MATHSSILAWRFHGQRSQVGYSSWGHKESDSTEQLTHNLHCPCFLWFCCREGRHHCFSGSFEAPMNFILISHTQKLDPSDPSPASPETAATWGMRPLPPLWVPSIRTFPPCPTHILQHQCKLPWGEVNSALPFITSFRSSSCDLVQFYSEPLSTAGEEAKTQQRWAICSNPHG